MNWEFREVLLRKGLSMGTVHRLMQLVSGGQTAINMIGPYFRNARGLRQVEPLFPIMFDFTVDALATILAKANAA
jgi:hypothetical protein